MSGQPPGTRLLPCPAAALGLVAEALGSLHYRGEVPRPIAFSTPDRRPFRTAWVSVFLRRAWAAQPPMTRKRRES